MLMLVVLDFQVNSALALTQLVTAAAITSDVLTYFLYQRLLFSVSV